MELHITITNKETGEILADTDTCAYLGAFDEGDKGTRVICSSECGPTTLAATAVGALHAAREAIADLPKPMRKLAEKLGKHPQKH